jgi:hypothetical protein
MSSGLGNVKQHLQEFVKQQKGLQLSSDKKMRDTFPLNLFDQSSQSILGLANNLNLQFDGRQRSPCDDILNDSRGPPVPKKTQ